ncbi:MAG: THUMP domain-containing protein, partial [Acutalibacteraceae bacterium]
MNELILIKLGEIALKGLNRKTFETVLVKNIKHRISSLGGFSVKTAQSTIYVTPANEFSDIDEAEERIKKVFGIAAYTRAARAEKNMDDIQRVAAEYLGEELSQCSTFKVEAKRSDKKFPLKSPEIC